MPSETAEPRAATQPQRPRIAAVRCRTYERAEVRAAVERAVGLLGGMGRFVKAGERALLKANLLRPAPRERRVLTDGEVLRAVAELVLASGGRAAVCDSPGLGSVEKNCRVAGISAALEGVPVESVELAAPRSAGSKLFPALEVSGELLDAPLVVNAPKLKTHVQMALTAAVKNMYGAVLGKRKAEWHLRAGTNRGAFARLIVECCRAVSPALTVADGVVAMQGEGPGSGEPFELGVIIAADHPVAADLAFMEIIGFDPRESPVHSAAVELGYGVSSLADCEVLGEPLENLKVRGFRRPETRFVMFPGFVGRALRRLLVSWPEVVESKCVRCGECAEVCAAAAITVEKGGRRPALIDHSKCIRCFCCHEICPERAIRVRTPMLARMFGWGARGR